MSSSTKSCFNRFCKEAKSDQLRRGWPLRNGDFAPLCHRCAAAFEEGRFCDIYHLAAAGWRSCESCGKRLHCGCIVSIYAYILLDAGGVSCLACTRRNMITVCSATNQIWPSFSSLSLPVPDRLKNLSVKNRNQIAGPSKVLAQWVRPFSMWNTSAAHSGLNPRMQYDVDGVKLISGECSASFVESKRLQDPSDRVNNLNHAVMDSPTSVNTAVDMVSGSHSLRRDETSINGLQGMPYEAHPDAHVNISLGASSLKEDASNPHFAVVPYCLPNDAHDLNSVQVSQPQQQTSSSPVAKQFNPSYQNGMDSSDETQKGIGRLQVDARGRSQLLPRYWPKITDKELGQTSRDSNSVITPLFEKMLSASDAGRVGRLVLPKRCAEAHFPTITQSDGLPLKVQDAKGKEWVLHFRFWPNNNSRMYVLEGVTPCIQSMELQAGDIVTFSRIDPEGKLVMGFRKAASVPPSDQDKMSLKVGSDVSKNSEVNDADPSGSWSKNDSSGYIANDVAEFKSFTPPTKRKSRGLGAKSKRLRIDQEDIMELKLTWEEAQGLLRPPPNHDHNVMFVEGHPFEEYEEAPILGKPTLFTTDQVGEKTQWAQCEDCLKWRKLPISALLPSRWTCSANLWDRKRSSCSSAQEVTSKQLEDIISSNKTASALKKTKPARKDVDAVEVSKGLSTLANLVILGEDDSLPSSAQTTTRHPRHRSGCTCIVCIQPPSGKPKHKETCICNVCLAVKRRKLSLMKHFSEKETESARKKFEQLQLPDNSQLEDDLPMIVGADQHQEMMANENCYDVPDGKKPVVPIGRIDLNIQPELDDVLSSLVSHSRGMMRLVSGSHKLYPILHGPTSSSHDGALVLNKTEPSEDGQIGNAARGDLDSGAQHDPSLGAGNDAPDPICISISASIPASS